MTAFLFYPSIHLLRQKHSVKQSNRDDKMVLHLAKLEMPKTEQKSGCTRVHVVRKEVLVVVIESFL